MMLDWGPMNEKEGELQKAPEAVSDLVVHHEEIPNASNHSNLFEQGTKIDARCSAGSPSVILGVNRLPPEILEKIFHLSVDRKPVILSPFKSGTFEPWILGHVCGRWRTVLWDSPVIWGRLSVQLSSLGSGSKYAADEMFSYNLMVTNEMFNYVLSKTNTPISLSAGGSECRAIFDTILFHSQRFRSLDLHGLQAHMLLSILNRPPHAWKILEALDINLQDINAKFDSTTSSLQEAPNLRTVKVSAHLTDYIPQLFILPWAQLVELHIAVMELPAVITYAILGGCANLISAHLSIQSGTVPTQGPITLRHLLRLGFTTTNRRTVDWDHFLQPFVTPSLLSLSLCSQQITIPTIKSVLLRLSHSLQELAVITRNPSENGESVESLLSLLPDIKRLDTTWIIPTSLVQKIRSGRGLLPFLTWGRWKVDPSGLAEILKMVDLYMAQTHHEHLFLSIGCYEGPGFKDVVAAYLRSYDTYKNYKRLNFGVYNANTTVVIIPESSRSSTRSRRLRIVSTSDQPARPI